MRLRHCSVLFAALLLLGAAPQPDTSAPFPAAARNALPNGVVIVSAPLAESPIAGAQVFVPAGLMQQPAGEAGIAALTASVVLRTPVEKGASLTDLAANAGGSATYTVDPESTRFYIESRAADLPRLVRDLARAIANPDAAQLPVARAELVDQVSETAKSPVQVAYGMVRQVRYLGTGFAFPDGGRASTLSHLAAADVQRFAEKYRHGNGTVVAILGAVSDNNVAAIGSAFSAWPAGAGAPPPQPTAVTRQSQVISHRNVESTWLALGYGAPSQFSKDFPAMLVIEALLGRGGDIHALSFGSGGAAMDDFVGTFYQYEARPGTFVIFLNGDSTTITQAMSEMEQGIARLRGTNLPADLLLRAKHLAIGDYLMSDSTLSDATWLLGRSAMSPDGLSFESALPTRIAAVSAADVKRVAKQYLARETVAVVLPITENR
jgi:zinc protease